MSNVIVKMDSKVLDDLVRKECISFSEWCADNFKKLHTLWCPYNSYTTKCENKNYTIEQLYDIYKLKSQSKEKVNNDTA